ncbi:MAG: hypothetical protein HC836_31845 [Richelia sp. RM2_1_2]|nr:hypothetical protein [Richelia sp. RM2_1_2]
MSCEFPSAADMRNRKKISVEILDEICAIKRAILLADEACNLETCVDGTMMTTAGSEISEAYYKVWKGLEDDRTKELQMNEIISCFEDSGYTITRVTNCDTGDTFKWCIVW